MGRREVRGRGRGVLAGAETPDPPQQHVCRRPAGYPRASILNGDGMPLGGYCNTCQRWVWLTPYGECENGHPAAAVTRRPAAQDRVATGGRRSETVVARTARAASAGGGATRCGYPGRSRPGFFNWVGLHLHRRAGPPHGVDHHGFAYLMPLLLTIASHRHARASATWSRSSCWRLAVSVVHALQRATDLPRPDVRRHAAPHAAGAAAAAVAGGVGAAAAAAAHHRRRGRRRHPRGACAGRFHPRERRQHHQAGGAGAYRGAVPDGGRHPDGAGRQTTQAGRRPQLPHLLPGRRGPHRAGLHQSVAHGGSTSPEIVEALGKAEASLDSVQQAFDRQLSNVLEDRVLDLESEIELLEKTVDMETMFTQTGGK